MKEDDGVGAGTCLGVLPGFITFRPLCFSPSLSLKPRSLSLNCTAIAHIILWYAGILYYGVAGYNLVYLSVHGCARQFTGSKQELLSLCECFVADPYQIMPCWSICLMLVKKMTRHSKTMDEGSVEAYFTRGSWSSTSSIRAAALKLSSTKGELG